MREEEIINSPTGLADSKIPKSETSSDISSLKGDSSNAKGSSSLQRNNEFCLEKVAALNKKLENENYALELKLQQAKQQSYQLQVGFYLRSREKLYPSCIIHQKA